MYMYIYIYIYSRGFAHAAALPSPLLAPPSPLGTPGRLFGAPSGSQEPLGEVWEGLGEFLGTPGELPESFCGALSCLRWSLGVPRDLHEASKKLPGDSQVSFWGPKGSPK